MKTFLVATGKANRWDGRVVEGNRLQLCIHRGFESRSHLYFKHFYHERETENHPFYRRAGQRNRPSRLHPRRRICRNWGCRCLLHVSYIHYGHSRCGLLLVVNTSLYIYHDQEYREPTFLPSPDRIGERKQAESPPRQGRRSPESRRRPHQGTRRSTIHSERSLPGRRHRAALLRQEADVADTSSATPTVGNKPEPRYSTASYSYPPSTSRSWNPSSASRKQDG